MPTGDPMKTPAKGNKPADMANVLVPKTRAAGGIWLNQGDVPHAFQYVIVYHNIKKYQHTYLHQDIWSNAAEPYISNEKEVYIKLELDPEAVEKVQQEEKNNKNIGVQGHGLATDKSTDELAQAEDSKEAEEGQPSTHRSTQQAPLPGEREKAAVNHDNIIVACAPYPTNKTHEVLPRYLTKVEQIDCADPMINYTFKNYFEGMKFDIVSKDDSQNCIWLKPQFNCPQGCTLWVASQYRSIKVVDKHQYFMEQKKYHHK